MKLAKGQYVYQVYLDKQIPEEAELIKWLEPLAKRRRASGQIARALIQFRCGGSVMPLSMKRETIVDDAEDDEILPMRQLSIEDLPALAEQDMVDNWSQSFKFGA